MEPVHPSQGREVGGGDLVVLYLVRHAESWYNAAKSAWSLRRLLGEVDHGLSPKGAEQCARLRGAVIEACSRGDPDALAIAGRRATLASPLTRALLTAHLGLPLGAGEEEGGLEGGRGGGGGGRASPHVLIALAEAREQCMMPVFARDSVGVPRDQIETRVRAELAALLTSSSSPSPGASSAGAPSEAPSGPNSPPGEAVSGAGPSKAAPAAPPPPGPPPGGDSADPRAPPAHFWLPEGLFRAGSLRVDTSLVAEREWWTVGESRAAVTARLGALLGRLLGRLAQTGTQSSGGEASAGGALVLVAHSRMIRQLFREYGGVGEPGASGVVEAAQSSLVANCAVLKLAIRFPDAAGVPPWDTAGSSQKSPQSGPQPHIKSACFLFGTGFKT